MLSTDKTLTKLRFQFLPDFASFLLRSKLREFVKIQLDLMFRVDFPVLKYYDLSNYTEEQLIDLSLPSYTEFLQAVADNKLEEHLADGIKKWEANQLPNITRDQLVIEDITLAAYVRKKALMACIHFYTQDVSTVIELVNELDAYVLEAESRSFHTYMNIYNEQVKHINEQLVKHEADLLEAQELASFGSFEWSFSGGQSRYTPEVYKIFEMTETSSLDDFMEFVHPGDREKLKEAINRAIRGEKDYECEYRFRKNGKEKVLWSKGIVSFADGKPMAMKGTVMDITDRHYMLKRLERNEELFKQAQKLTKMGNWTWDLETGHINFSDELYRIYGLQPGIPINFERFVSFVVPEEREKVIKLLNYSIQTCSPHTLNFRIKRENRKVRVIHRNVEVLVDEKGKPYKLCGTGQDITEEEEIRKELESKTQLLAKANLSLEQKNLALERSNKELTSFSYVASHDLQEPIRKIKTFSNLILEREKNLSPEGADCFERIIQSSARMQKLIDDLLSFSRTQLDEKTLKPVNLNAILEEVEMLHRESIKEDRLKIKADRLPVVDGIPFQIQQLFENIISNSIKYSKPGKSTEVDIRTELVNKKQLSFSNLNGNNFYHKITFSDKGIGFEQKYSEKIFEIFQRLHGKGEYSGTGIGLSICKRIVENHKGHITASAELDKGATFEIYLPSTVNQ